MRQIGCGKRRARTGAAHLDTTYSRPKKIVQVRVGARVASQLSQHPRVVIDIKTRVCRSGGEGVLADLGGGSLLGATDSLFLGLEGGQTSAEGTILLLAQVVRRVSLLLELVAGGLDALLGEDGEDLGDVLSHGSDLGELDLLLADLADAKGGELLAVTGELFDQLGLFVLPQRMGSDFVHFCACLCS